MKNILFLICSLFLISGCGNSLVEKPDNLIDDDVMIDIFYDLAIIDAGRNSSYQNGQNSFVPNNFILKKYEIDSITFAKSNKYYAADVSKYKRMFKIVKDKLTDKKTEIDDLSKPKTALKP
jgi:Domain of unknown function (DUF4296)